MSLFKQASQGEILRAAQKDSSFTDKLQRNVSNFCLELLGPRVWLRYKWLLEPSTRFFYYMVTTGLDLQTLGEEYTGIIQVEHGQRKLPSKFMRYIMIFLHTFGPRVVKRILKKVKQHYIESIDQKSTKKIEIIFESIEKCLDFVEKLNICIFYFHGTFYHLSKRLTGIGYVKYAGFSSQPQDTTRSSFKILGIITSFNLLLAFIYNFYKSRNKAIIEEEDEEDLENEQLDSKGPIPVHERCSLCLDRLGRRGGVSSTICGHLHCWTCIHHSIRAVPECPICRQPLGHNNIIPCRNY